MSQDFCDDHLRSFPTPKPLLDYEDVPFFGSLPELLRSLRTTLGLEVDFVRAGGKLPDLMARCFTVRIENGKSPGCLVLRPSKNPSKCLLAPSAQEEFLTSLSYLLGDAYRWQQTLRKYQEELASLVPLPSIHPNDVSFTDTLFNILKESTKILGCHASSLYTLDSKENTLRLRSCWGLPEERLLGEPRSLHDSLADLEAILGQVVVLNDDFLFEAWGAPEDFQSAACVPITSPVSVIGTLWFFSDERRDFSEKDVRIMEIVTGRLAAELERSALLRELVEVRKVRQPA